MEYNFREIEQKWQKNWVEMNTYKVTEDENRKKFYVLNMFPYPSGAGLHVAVKQAQHGDSKGRQRKASQRR